jgi:hypothetical protein
MVGLLAKDVPGTVPSRGKLPLLSRLLFSQASSKADEFQRVWTSVWT